MGIISLVTDVPGQIGDNPRRPKLITSDSLATITTAGYLNTSNLQGQVILPTDVLDVIYDWVATTNVGTYSAFVPTITNGVITINPDVSEGNILFPVVSGDFAIFNGTTGQIKDGGYLPSNASKTRVVMANGTTIANHIGVFTDTTGTLGEDAATAINGGNIQAGLSGTAGTVSSFPATAARGSLILAGVANDGNTNTTISNEAMGQATVTSIPDPGIASTSFILADAPIEQSINTGNLIVTQGSIVASEGGIIQAGSANHAGSLRVFPSGSSDGNLNITCSNQTGNTVVNLNADPMNQATVVRIGDPAGSSSYVVQTQSNIQTNKVYFTRHANIPFSDLSSGGTFNMVIAPFAGSQFLIMDIRFLIAIGLSGGGGNRNLHLTDGSNVFNNTGITAALLGSPVYTLWGGTGNPLLSNIDAISEPGSNIFFTYTGGTTDYTSGSITVACSFVQVA